MKFNTTQTVAWCISKSLFYIGDGISILFRLDWFAWLYPTYTNIMLRSCTLSEKYNLGIWTAPTEDDDCEPDHD